MRNAEQKRVQAREELTRAEAALRRASLLLDTGGAIYEGAVADQQASQVNCLAARLIPPTPDPTPTPVALAA